MCSFTLRDDIINHDIGAGLTQAFATARPIPESTPVTSAFCRASSWRVGSAIFIRLPLRLAEKSKQVVAPAPSAAPRR
jgi:hypothetical protein